MSDNPIQHADDVLRRLRFLYEAERGSTRLAQGYRLAMAQAIDLVETLLIDGLADHSAPETTNNA